MIEPDADVQKLLSIAEACGPGFGAIADRYGLALVSAEPEVVARATFEFHRLLADVLSRSAAEQMKSIPDGLESIARFMRVCRDPNRMAELMGGIGLIAAQHSRRFELAIPGDDL